MSRTAPRLRPRGEDGGPDAAPVVTDGPFPETKELIAGWLVEAARVWPEQLPARSTVSKPPAAHAHRVTA